MSNSTIEIGSDSIFLPHYRGRLTEGVTYDYRNHSILWVDIIQGQINRVFLDNLSFIESIKWDKSGESIGAITLTNDENIYLACSKSGLAYANFKIKKLTYFFKYPDSDFRLRSNDGIIDPFGNLWIGLMTDFDLSAKEGGIKPEGKLYRITPDLKIDLMISDSLISNGLAFNSKGTEFYWTDSLTYTIWKFDYDVKSNKLSNKRPFFQSKLHFKEFESPEPDGLCITNGDEIYTTVFSTSTVVHLSKNGDILEKFEIDAKRVTCVTIGDNSLYVTTGNLKLDDFKAEIDSNDKSGDLGGFLFKIETGKPLNGQRKAIWGGKV
ncbi:unnamed protein product [Candida verbasci]|uniref:SMP-30/Gluconolactonase/LRE-like region domain-containing protein n=1 Tax=Candida verbasci TaxID=1227364 RepID=A0A9W4XML7_9ASCO|nr:unnamed protein product [Candida verbasci]